MVITLAENIRKFRKERALTQEQLAEVLGVTTGAVYKWEAKLSLPELELIVRMADFFDVSVDVLLGYEIRDNRHDATVKRLREYRRDKDREGLAEAEKALKKYPHSFFIVYESAAVFRAFAFESGDREMSRRALELLEKSRLLLAQNDDPKISELTICGKMAQTYLVLGETDKAVELWKTHDADGLFDHNIGQVLAAAGRTDEAVPFLSEAMAKIVSDMCGTVTGYVNVFLRRGDHDSAKTVLRMAIGFLSGLCRADKPCFIDKISSALLATLAGSQFMSGQRNEARETLRQAKEQAEFFDSAPSYDEGDIRFIGRIEGASAHDDIGATATDAVGNAVNGFESEEFAALWHSVAEKEQGDEQK